MSDRPLDWTDLLTLADEIKASDGPGTRAWNAEASKTRAINDRVMSALRDHGGTLPGELGAIPCLILTTIGARSGTPRAVPLFCLTVDGQVFIIGSMGGAPRNPPWYFNLLKTPEVVVEKDGECWRAVATPLAGAARDRVFTVFADTYAIFAHYQAGVRRVIPIVELRRPL